MKTEKLGMNTEKSSYQCCAVVIGAGHGGVAAAAALRDAGYEGRLVLIGSEPHLPYERPPLSKAFIKGTIGEDGLSLRAASWYSDHAVELVSDTWATGIDLAGRTVATTAGDFAWTDLILATGTTARRLAVQGAELGRVHTIRTLADARALQPALSQPSRFVVVGAGFIGLEFAAVASDLGHSVTVVEAAPTALTRAVSSPVAEHLVQGQVDSGVRFHFGATIERLLPHVEHDSQVGSVELVGGASLAADHVVVGVGAEVATDLAVGAGLVADGFGIRVDEHLRTSHPHVFAVGDCVSFVPSGRDQRCRLESVQNASEQARAVAATITGTPTPYKAVPWFWSDQSNRRLQIAGLSSPSDSSVVVGDPATGKFSVLRYDGVNLTAVESVNRPGDHMAARAVLKQGRSPQPTEASEPEFTLKAFAAKTAMERAVASQLA